MLWRARAQSLPIFLLGLYLPTLPETLRRDMSAHQSQFFTSCCPAPSSCKGGGFLSKTTASLTNLTLNPNSSGREKKRVLPTYHAISPVCFPPKTLHNRTGKTLLLSSSRKNVPGFGRLCRLKRPSFRHLRDLVAIALPHVVQSLWGTQKETRPSSSFPGSSGSTPHSQPAFLPVLRQVSLVLP